jgi:TP901 family phage tail tape measure protein
VEIVTIKVVTDKTALTELQTQVSKLNGKKVKIDTSGTSKSFDTVATSASRAGDSVMGAYKKMLLWSAAGTLIYAPVRAFESALKTLKAVDDELVEVRKVTGDSSEQLAALEKQAYKTASAYGVSADKYLSSVAAFSRAGYGSQASSLAELSQKTQIVGDVTQDVADQFLLSVDAAYQYGGSVEQLTKVLDGANQIDNKYATSISKIAEGLGTVAPVAAQAHMSVGELSAAIGTITAVTQRSGSEAARAMRALILNIVGDTKTEIEDGVTWTSGEIKNLQDVIRQYAPAAYEAAKATGSVIDPMQAVAGLSQSMKDGMLTEQKLMEMTSDLGGKLRTSQLLALIQHFDMYSSMLTDFGDAAGSADKEVANAMDSWSRKAQVLDDTWTQMVSDLLDTGTIKDGLDALTGVVKFLDTDAGRAAISITGLSTAASLAIKGFKALKATDIGAFFSLLIHDVTGAKDALTLLSSTFMASPLFWGAAVAGGTIWAFSEIINADEKAFKELSAEIETTKSEIESLEQERDKLANTDVLTQSEYTRLDLLNAQIEAKKTLLKQDQEAQFKAKYWSRSDTTFDSEGNQYEFQQSYIGGIEQLIDEYNALDLTQAENLDQFTEMSEKQSTLKGKLAATAEELENYRSLGIDIGQENEDVLSQIEDLLSVTEASTSRVSLLTQAINSQNAGQAVCEATMNKLLAIFPELYGHVTKTAEGYVISNDALQNLITSQIQYYTATGNTTATQAFISAEAQKRGYIIDTTLSIQEQIAALLNLYTAERLATGDTLSEISRGTTYQNLSAAYLNSMKSASGGSKSTSGGSGGGGSSAKATDTQLEKLKDIVSLRQSELDIMQKRGDSDDKQIAKMHEIQAALHNEADYLRKTGASQEDINKLSSQWLDIQSNINDLLKAAQKQKLDAADDIMSALDDELDEQTDALDAQIDALKSQKDERENQLELEEKQLAVEQARIALENAQKERTVRYYNSASGQWEWMANNKDVEKAEEDYQKAKDELTDYYSEQAYNSAVAEIEAQKDAIKAAYKAFNDAWDDAKEAVEDGSMTLADAYASMAQTSSDLFNKYAVDLSGALQNLLTALGLGAAASTAVQPGAASGAGGSWSNTGGTVDAYMPNIGQIRVAVANGKTLTSGLPAGTIVYSSNGEHAWEITGGDSVTAGGTGYTSTQLYDSGGILTGKGGIKGTSEPELVIPPPLASAMLSPQAGAMFKQRSAEMGLLYGAPGASAPSHLTESSTSNTYHTGPNYYLNGIKLGAGQENLTVKQLAQLAGNLGTMNQPS